MRYINLLLTLTMAMTESQDDVTLTQGGMSYMLGDR